MNQNYKKRMRKLMEDGYYSPEMLFGAIRKCDRSLRYYTKVAYGERIPEAMEHYWKYLRLRNRCYMLLQEDYGMALPEIRKEANAVSNKSTPSNELLEEINQMLSSAV